MIFNELTSQTVEYNIDLFCGKQNFLTLMLLKYMECKITYFYGKNPEADGLSEIFVKLPKQTRNNPFKMK